MPAETRRRRRGSGGAILHFEPSSPPAGLVATRASAALYTDANGVTQTAGVNVLRDAHFIGGRRMILLEATRTNHFLNSGAPVTQTTPVLAVGTYTVSVTGPGNVTISAGTATITGAAVASAGVPRTFQVTVAGTVTYTVAAGPTTVQAELGASASSYIATAGAAVIRAGDVVTIPFVFPSQSLTALYSFIDLGTQITGAGIFEIGQIGVHPALASLASGSVNTSGTWNNGTANQFMGTAASGIVQGDLVEVRVFLTPAGVAQYGIARNGGAEVIYAPTAGQAISGANWGGGTIKLNQYTTGAAGYQGFLKLAIAMGVHSLGEMRSL